MREEPRLVPLAAPAATATIIVRSVAASPRAGATTAHKAPTVAVARAAVKDLSRDLSLPAELRPFQEIQVMAVISRLERHQAS